MCRRSAHMRHHRGFYVSDINLNVSTVECPFIGVECRFFCVRCQLRCVDFRMSLHGRRMSVFFVSDVSLDVSTVECPIMGVECRFLCVRCQYRCVSNITFQSRWIVSYEASNNSLEACIFRFILVCFARAAVLIICLRWEVLCLQVSVKRKIAFLIGYSWYDIGPIWICFLFSLGFG